LIFAGAVMIKLAHEGQEYYEDAKQIPAAFRNITIKTLTFFYSVTRFATFWIPELSGPKVKKMNVIHLAKWSFILPFIIGLDDFIGYMGAMTIYNVFSLLFGIYLADIVIDIIIFVSPSFTKKLVESPSLSFVATYAFIYLAYKSFSESYILLHERFHISGLNALIWVVFFVLFVLLLDLVNSRFIRKNQTAI